MQVQAHTGTEVALDIDGVVVLLIHRIDRYQSRGRWGQPEQDVEIWEAADGRVIRLARPLNVSVPWTALAWV
ncbi:hypothetical protein [Deinococcus sp. QL22]|uniref:hypothetical protein n=1 Tax=Deinococcus sp. QL22 TaxID=2939437 RepID=UPI0020180E68|nr:hypothetical protein [Deinococcus sp. QL22]UQN09066.1 hypothetical protein M1R55_23735 [Deinococcus sp. QL22]